MEHSPLPVMLLLIAVIPVAQSQGSSKAVVSIKPDTHVFIGEIVTLRCDIQGGGNIQGTYSFYKNTNRIIYETNQEYRFRPGKDSDSGNYTCIGHWNHSQMSEISDAVTLTVSEKPKPTVRVNPQSSVYTGDAVTLNCELQQGTGWEFKWYQNNQQLQNLFSKQQNTLKVTVSNAGETEYRCLAHRTICSNSPSGSCSDHHTHFSDPVEITVKERTAAVLNVSTHSWLTEGDSVTLSCEVTDSSTNWTYSWYTLVPYRDGVTQITNKKHFNVSVELLSDSSRGSGGSYTLSPAALHHTGVYMCRGEREQQQPSHTQYSNLQPVWITGESRLVSLIISPNTTQHFTTHSLSLSCEDQSHSTGWTVRRYTHTERVLDCSWWGSVTGSTCNISSLSTSYTGVYWCESESGENSNPVNITVHDGHVILESPVHPVTEGHPLTLRCLYRNSNSSKLRADFYKDGSVLQNQTTEEMIIKNVSKSDEGFYCCKHPERGESPKSWISVRRQKPSVFSDSKASDGSVVLAVGLGFVFITLLI